jgi:hypothetical protein
MEAGATAVMPLAEDEETKSRGGLAPATRIATSHVPPCSKVVSRMLSSCLCGRLAEAMAAASLDVLPAMMVSIRMSVIGLNGFLWKARGRWE